MGSSFCWSSQEDRLTSPRISWQMERDFRNRHVVPAGSGSPHAKGWGRSSNSRCPDKLQESLKSPANMALQSHKLWDTNNPIDRNPTKGDAPTNSCSEPQNGAGSPGPDRLYATTHVPSHYRRFS